MSRTTSPQPAVARHGLQTGGMCCGMSVEAATLAFGPWAGMYRLAFERATAQVAAEDRRRRLLGHAAPSLN